MHKQDLAIFNTKRSIAAFALAFACAGANAATLLSDNFNSETAGLNQLTFANFAVSGGTVDVIGNGFFDFFPGSGLFIDLDGSSGQAGLFSSQSSFSLVPGTTYQLSYSLAGSQRGDTNMVTVSLGSAFSQSYTFLSSDPLTTFSNVFTVAAPVSAMLTFQNAGGDNVGAILDNVSLTSTMAPVPEPETYAMMLAGLGIMGFVARRRRKI